AMVIELPDNIVHISREAALVLARNDDMRDMPVTSLLRRLTLADLRRVVKEFTDAVLLGEPLATEMRFRRPGGGVLTLSVRAETEIVNEEPARIRMIVQDVSELKEAEARVRYLAHHDVLTGLANRHFFNEQISHAMQQGNGRRLRKGALHLIDLDRFKE
ncbi:MAG: GGDEF domain-containing protein, partial [Geminicoccaceae bacterium]|nr:GGDEF domain-containing protein [Geminicoccaceae bacterium]